MSSCSLLLSKSGASASIKDQVKQHFLQKRFNEGDPKGYIKGSFTSEGVREVSGGDTSSHSKLDRRLMGTGAPIQTTSSMTGTNVRHSSRKKSNGGHDIGSTVSG